MNTADDFIHHGRARVDNGINTHFFNDRFVLRFLREGNDAIDFLLFRKQRNENIVFIVMGQGQKDIGLINPGLL